MPHSENANASSSSCQQSVVAVNAVLKRFSKFGLVISQRQITGQLVNQNNSNSLDWNVAILFLINIVTSTREVNGR